MKPAAPSNLSAQAASCSQINLYWNDNSGNEEGYKIYRNGSYVGQVGMNTTNYQDTGLSGNTSYSYQVRAYRGSIESDASNTVNISTPPCTTPKPDLVPAQWSGWQYPIVPSSIRDTTVVNTLYSDQPTYVDWGVANNGNASSGGDVFEEIYVDTTQLARHNYGEVTAGMSWAFFDWPGWTQSQSGWHTLRVIVDPDDLIDESDETNNVWEHQFYWEPSCNDQNEPNDTSSGATSLSFGQTRSANICGLGDYDYYRFTGTAGQRIVVDIDAEVDGSLLDSYLSLFDSDGTTILREHDDEILGERPDSHLGYELPHDGTYYIRVRDWDHPNVGGTDYFYTIYLLTDNANPTAQVTSPGHYAWLDPDLQTITISVNDNESGIRNVTFYWHDADWENSDWIVLEDDWDPSDGWTYGWDTSSIPEQQGGAVYIYAYDWAGNYAGWGSYEIGMDRTPPTASAEVQQMYGDAPFLDFWVTWWDASDNLSGIASYDVQYRDGAGGTWTNLLTGTTNTSYRFVGQNGHTYYFRARARDWAGNQSTYASGNGDAQNTVQICATSADAHESDNSYTAAKTITTDGIWQSHNFHAAGDQDWVEFAATAGITYTLVTANTGGHADTVLYLYRSNGSTLIDSNDDDPDNWPASRLEWGARQDGTYYVKVEHWDPYAYGCTTDYGLSIAETGTFEVSSGVFLPIILKNRP